MQDYFDRIVSELRGKSYGAYAMCFCPCHDDGTSPALKVSLIDNGQKISVNCYAGCDWKHVRDTLVSRDLLPKFQAISTGKNKEEIIRYEYKTETGETTGTKCRKGEGKAKRIWWEGGRPQKPCLYKVQGLLNSIGPIYLPEGEKDCDSLGILGLTATVSSEGTSRPWSKDFNHFVEGRDIIILEDNDPAGKKRSYKLLQALKHISKSIKLIRFLCMKPGSDITDWLHDGHSQAELEDLVSKAKDLKPLVPSAYALSDLGNAARFANHHHAKARYCEQSHAWMVYDGKRWKDSGSLAVELAKETIALMHEEATTIEDPTIEEQLEYHAMCSENIGRITAMINLARTDPILIKDVEEFDTKRRTLNFTNGTLNLETFELAESDPLDFCTKLIPYPYDAKAECPTWCRFITRIFGGDPELIAYIQAALGYAVTGDCSERLVFFCWGTGTNGKSTLLKIVQSVMGADYTAKPQSKILIDSSFGDGIPNDLAALKGKRYIWCSETEEQKKLKTAFVKEITGNEPLTARFLHKEFFTFYPQFVLFLATNNKPNVSAHDKAIWKRMRLIPFNVEIPKEEVDTHLDEKLLLEAPGIINWLVEGAKSWALRGLPECPAVDQATSNYQSDQDSVKRFLDDRCEFNSAMSTSVGTAFSAYESWCEASGEDPLSKIKFGSAMKFHGYVVKKGHKGIRKFDCLRLKDGATDEDEEEGYVYPGSPALKF